MDFLSNLLYKLKQAGCTDRVFSLSDTFDSNKKMLENLEIRPEDILSPNDPDAIDKIVAEIDKERDDLLEYRENVKRWKSFNKKLDINNLDDLLEFYDPVTRQFEPPKHWLNGRKPAVGLLCDDIQSTPLIGSKKFKNLCIKCSHVVSFGNGEPPIGVSIFIAVQNYTAQGNEGIPKSIRGNINCCAIRKSGNMKEINRTFRSPSKRRNPGSLRLCYEQRPGQQAQLSFRGSYTQEAPPQPVHDELH